jgi:hypothetical protein
MFHSQDEAFVVYMSQFASSYCIKRLYLLKIYIFTIFRQNIF